MTSTYRSSAAGAGKTTSPDYLGWRGDLLAQLAFARLPRVMVFKPLADQGADYLVATDDGLCFFVQVRAFSSSRTGMSNVADLPELSWQVDRSLLDRARRSRSPVVLFLFDADTEHGRFLRIDTLSPPATAARFVMLHLPIENTIGRQSLHRLLDELRAAPEFRAEC